MKKKVILIILTITMLLVIGSNTNVNAEDVNDLQARKSELQAQISESNEQIEDIHIELTQNLEELNNLNQKITTYEQEIALLEENLNKISEEINIVSEKLSRIQENYNNQKNTLKNRLVAIYEAGDIYYLDVLLKSNNISEFISNYFMIGEIAKHDNDLLENIGTQKKQIETIKSVLDAKKEDLGKIKDNKEETAISLENSRIIRNAYIAKLTNDEKETQAKIDMYTVQLNNLDSQITALTNISIGEDYVGGEFIWPAPGYTTITSRFGMRVHPILKTYSVHKGTDIGAPTGSYVVASNDGTVITSTYTTGYGNMIMIDHGGGIVTLYAHGVELIAKLRDQVKKGDLIMKAGSTGWSTGPHLHFEVRFNGQAIDSLEFLQNQSKYLNTENGEIRNDIDNNTSTEKSNSTNEENHQETEVKTNEE